MNKTIVGRQPTPADFPPNFSAAEFLARSGPGGVPIQWDDVPSDVQRNLHSLAWTMQTLRDTTFNKRRVFITSGYRTPERNQQVGGARNSTHLKGRGVDFVVEGESPRTTQARLQNWGGGLGFGDTFTHLDTGPKRRWNY